MGIIDERLKARRLHGYQAAVLAGITYSRWRRLRQGLIKEPTPEEVEAIAKVLNVDPENVREEIRQASDAACVREALGL